MDQTFFDAIPQFQRLKETHYAAEGVAPDAPHKNWEMERFTRRQVQENAFFPKHELLEQAQDAVRHLYPRDVGNVQTGDTLGRLFQKAA